MSSTDSVPVTAPAPETVPETVPVTAPPSEPEPVVASVPVSVPEPDVMETQSLAGQSVFVGKVLKSKKNGFFVDLGAGDPVSYNNTVTLENIFGWKGLLIENGSDGEGIAHAYDHYRKNSSYALGDTTTMDYASVFVKNAVPKNVDYLSVNLTVSDGTEIKSLEKLSEVFDKYKFATVTFKHDFYNGDHFNTLEQSRQIFNAAGYKLVFPDVSNDGNQFNDWYVYPALVDMNYVNGIIQTESMDYKAIIDMMP